MKEPKVSTNDSCPVCSGVDWKLAKMLILAGVTNVDTESSGGGFGIGVGVGRGHGGVGVNYQGVDLNTAGTHTTATALEYAAPQAPDQYDKKNYWLEECSTLLKKAAEEIVKIDQFAITTENIKPSSPGSVSLAESRYETCHYHLRAFQAYEREKALWDRSRVCMRCGESFVTDEGKQSPQASVNLPPFVFEGQYRRCPHCKSYHWKTAEAFFSIQIRKLKADLKGDMERLQEALDYANSPNEGGFWKRLGRKLLTLKPEEANRKVEQTQAQLAATIEAREHAMQQHPDFQNTRACSACEAIYTLVADPTNLHWSQK